MKSVHGLWILLSLCATAWALEGSASIPAFSSGSGQQPPAPWHISGLPERYQKPITQFEITSLDGQRVLSVKADQSWGTLSMPLAQTIKPSSLLRWRWRLDQALSAADIRSKGTEDAALKVCVSFAMPSAHIPANEKLLFRIAQALSQEPLPTATICYIWASKEPLGYAQRSLYTRRVQFVVLANDTRPLKRWQTHERSIEADFQKYFGLESPAVAAVNALLIGADSDNTHGQSLGYVGDIELLP